jgi:serine/threonine-protein kinase
MSALNVTPTLFGERYTVQRELGRGGMATVYLAEDRKHDRHVAIKVLKPELAAVLGGERFVVEIRTTASLQHPHILPLFDSGTADGFLYYVMPYIQGETIREKLNRETQLGVEEAVRITREVADALDYAHRHGVIHRDIKPENILLHDRRALVMDFGIALAVSAAAGGRMTETGLSLGTPHYMSPEQATADKDITGRSDIYSLASVLYEMLTGNPPHTGASAQQIIMKIITEPAQDVTRLRRSVPPHVAAALMKALEKVPADRFDSAKAFVDALTNPAFGSATGTVSSVDATADRRWRTRFFVLAGTTALVTIAALVAWRAASRAPELPVRRLDLSLGPITQSGNSDVIISPDGSMVAVAGLVNGEQAIYLRRLDGDPEFRKVPGTESADGSPSFSPDSRSMVFRRQSDQKLVRISVSGSGATAIGQTTRTVFPFAHWGPNDQIVYHGGTAIGPIRVAADGGPPDTLGIAGAMRTSFLLPDGSGLLYTRQGLHVLDFRTDSSTRLVPFGGHPTYVPTGHVLFIGETGGLFAVPFDLNEHRTTGPPVGVVERVAATTLVRGYSVSNDGVLVYHDGPGALGGAMLAPTRLLLVTFGGGVDTLRLPPGRRQMPRFSPDGRSIAYEVLSGRATDTDLYTFDLITGTNTRITFEGDNDDPVWSPDGKRIAFTKGSSGSGEDIYVKAADNSGTEQLVLALPANQNALAWLRGDTIVFMSDEAGQADLYVKSLGSSDKPKAYLEAPWIERELQVSPDGQLAVFTSAETGGTDVWIRDFPVPQGKWQVSSNQLSSSPRWSRDGRYVYYWRTSSVVSDTLFRARVERTPSVVVKAPEVMLAIDIAGVENWDLHPDGKRIIVTVSDAPQGASGTATARASRYVVAENWFRELKALTSKRSGR